MKKENRELLIFLVTVYGMTFLVASPWLITWFRGTEPPIFSGGLFSPAAGIILAKCILDRENPLLPKKFFLSLLILSFLSATVSFLTFFFPETFGAPISVALSFLLGFLPFLLLLAEGKESRAAYGLTGQRWKETFLFAGLLLLLSHLSLRLIWVGLFGGLSLQTLLSMGSDTGRILPALLAQLPSALLLSFPTQFSEEYGWRGYLQPCLQKKLGPKSGVLLTSLLWELWHLPAVLFLFSTMAPELPLAQLIITRLVSTVTLGIFLGYAYMKTQNVWCAVLLHGVHNLYATAASAAFADTSAGSSSSWQEFLLWCTVRLLVFLPFLFTKPFRRQPTGLPSPTL